MRRRKTFLHTSTPVYAGRFGLLTKPDWLRWSALFFGASYVPSAKCNFRTPRVLVLLALAIAVAWVMSAAAAFAQGSAPIVAQIRIEGNLRVETDAIRIHISQQAGEPLDDAAVDKDIKAIYKMGFFDTVDAKKEIINGQLVLVYVVKERPQITDVRFDGMKALRSTDDKIVAAVKIHPGSILDPARAKESINGIQHAQLPELVYRRGHSGQEEAAGRCRPAERVLLRQRVSERSRLRAEDHTDRQLDKNPVRDR